MPTRLRSWSWRTSRPRTRRGTWKRATTGNGGWRADCTTGAGRVRLREALPEQLETWGERLLEASRLEEVFESDVEH